MSVAEDSSVVGRGLAGDSPPTGPGIREAGGERRPRVGGMLSVVGTPIGNLGDASPRLVETLRRADVVLCEDTRVTARLLSALGVHAHLERADEHVLPARIAPTLARVAAGGRVAFVSDAGMPGVSDPGQPLVDAALDAGLPVEIVPGPSAVTCALVASGLPMEHFFFEGFLPRKAAAMAARLRELAAIPAALVIYESPRRVVTTLARIAEVLPERHVALVRELTKLHEECVRATAVELAEIVAARGFVRGECVIVIAPPDQAPRAAAPAPSADGLDAAIAEGLFAGAAASALAKRLAREFALPRQHVYDRVVALSHGELRVSQAAPKR